MTTIDRAWLGSISPDGKWLAYGNGEVCVRERATGATTVVATNASFAGWHHGQVAVSRYVPNGRQLEFYDPLRGTFTPSGIPVEQEPGYYPTLACVDGVIVSSLPGQHFRDGRPINTDPKATRIEDFDGVSTFYKVTDGDPWASVVETLETGQAVWADRIPLTNARLDKLSNGSWLSANLAGLMLVVTPSGNRFTGPANESRGLMFEWRDVAYACTVTVEPGPTPVWIIRKLTDWTAESPAYVLRGQPFAGMSWRLDGDVLTVLGHDEASGLLAENTIDLTAAMQPYVRTPEPVPTLPAIVIGAQRAIWRGSLSGVVVGNIGNEPGRENWIEDPRYINAESESRLCALFIDTKLPSELLRETAAVALVNNIPVVLDDDGDVNTAIDFGARLSERGVRVIHARQHYPRPGQSIEDFERIALDHLHPCVIRPGYTAGGLWTEHQVAECNLVLDRLIAAHPEVIMDLSFGLDRAPRSQWCADHFRALCAATPTPSVSLRRPVPVVDPPPVPPPVEPQPPRKTGDGGKDAKQIAGGIGAAVAGFIALFTFWKKRKKVKS